MSGDTSRRARTRGAAVLLAALLALAACGGDGGSVAAGGVDTQDGGTDAGEGWRGALLGEPQPRPAFTLTDTEGRPFDFTAQTRGKLTLLFFGYTSCPDVCPIHMATLSAALEQPGMPDPTVVFVTTDPRRDTPERLRRWLDRFDPSFIGLRGTPEEIDAAERAAGVAESIVEADGDNDDDYAVGHAAQLLAYTPDDLAHVAYPFGVRRQDWEADLPRLLDEWGRPGAAPAGLTVDDAWTAAAEEVAAVYLSVENPGEDDRVVGATSDIAGSVSFMGPTDDPAMSSADPPGGAGGVDHAIPSGTTRFEPGGWHVMLADLRRPLVAGETVTLRLELEHAGPVDAEVEVVSWDDALDRIEAEGGGR